MAWVLWKIYKDKSHREKRVSILKRIWLKKCTDMDLILELRKRRYIAKPIIFISEHEDKGDK